MNEGGSIFSSIFKMPFRLSWNIIKNTVARRIVFGSIFILAIIYSSIVVSFQTHNARPLFEEIVKIVGGADQVIMEETQHYKEIVLPTKIDYIKSIFLIFGSLYLLKNFILLIYKFWNSWNTTSPIKSMFFTFVSVFAIMLISNTGLIALDGKEKWYQDIKSYYEKDTIWIVMSRTFPFHGFVFFLRNIDLYVSPIANVVQGVGFFGNKTLS